MAPSKVIYHVTPRQGVKIDAALKEDALLHPEWSGWFHDCHAYVQDVCTRPAHYKWHVVLVAAAHSMLHVHATDAAMEAQEVRYLLEAGETATITLEQGPSGLLSTRPLVVETKDNMPETAMPLYVESLTMQRP